MGENDGAKFSVKIPYFQHDFFPKIFAQCFACSQGSFF